MSPAGVHCCLSLSLTHTIHDVSMLLANEPFTALDKNHVGKKYFADRARLDRARRWSEASLLDICGNNINNKKYNNNYKYNNNSNDNNNNFNQMIVNNNIIT